MHILHDNISEVHCYFILLARHNLLGTHISNSLFAFFPRLIRKPSRQHHIGQDYNLTDMKTENYELSLLFTFL
jgi:hypothetical protein